VRKKIILESCIVNAALRKTGHTPDAFQKLYNFFTQAKNSREEKESGAGEEKASLAGLFGFNPDEFTYKEVRKGFLKGARNVHPDQYSSQSEDILKQANECTKLYTELYGQLDSELRSKVGTSDLRAAKFYISSPYTPPKQSNNNASYGASSSRSRSDHKSSTRKDHGALSTHKRLYSFIKKWHSMQRGTFYRYKYDTFSLFDENDSFGLSYKEYHFLMLFNLSQNKKHIFTDYYDEYGPMPFYEVLLISLCASNPFEGPVKLSHFWPTEVRINRKKERYLKKCLGKLNFLDRIKTGLKSNHGIEIPNFFSDSYIRDHIKAKPQVRAAVGGFLDEYLAGRVADLVNAKFLSKSGGPAFDALLRHYPYLEELHYYIKEDLPAQGGEDYFLNNMSSQEYKDLIQRLTQQARTKGPKRRQARETRQRQKEAQQASRRQERERMQREEKEKLDEEIREKKAAWERECRQIQKEEAAREAAVKKLWAGRVAQRIPFWRLPWPHPLIIALSGLIILGGIIAPLILSTLVIFGIISVSTLTLAIILGASILSFIVFGFASLFWLMAVDEKCSYTRTYFYKTEDLEWGAFPLPAFGEILTIAGLVIPATMAVLFGLGLVSTGGIVAPLILGFIFLISFCAAGFFINSFFFRSGASDKRLGPVNIFFISLIFLALSAGVITAPFVLSLSLLGAIHMVGWIAPLVSGVLLVVLFLASGFALVFHAYFLTEYITSSKKTCAGKLLGDMLYCPTLLPIIFATTCLVSGIFVPLILFVLALAGILTLPGVVVPLLLGFIFISATTCTTYAVKKIFFNKKNTANKPEKTRTDDNTSIPIPLSPQALSGLNYNNTLNDDMNDLESDEALYISRYQSTSDDEGSFFGDSSVFQ